MKTHLVNGEDTGAYKQELQSQIDKINDVWNDCEKRVMGIINKLCFVKGFKCLFLFISIYCVFDLLAIPALKNWTNDYLISYMALFNFVALMYAVFLSVVIVQSKWDDYPDSKCYIKTMIFLVVNIFGIIPLWILVHCPNIALKFIEINFDFIAPIRYFWDFDIWVCLFLPFYPYLFAIIFIAVTLLRIKYIRMQCRKELLKKIKELVIEKKKYEDAVATLTKRTIKFR